MKKDEIKLEKMCCYSCATTVEKELTRLEGIKEALVDFPNKTMVVEYDENVVDKTIIEAKAKEVIDRFD